MTFKQQRNRQTTQNSSLSDAYLNIEFTEFLESYTASLFGQTVTECPTGGDAAGHRTDEGTTYYMPTDTM
jgi:hypothetical protein